MIDAFSCAALFPVPPKLHFRYEQDHCPYCNAGLKVQKTYRRRPCTLHIGRFVAWETVLYCPCCSGSPSFHSKELAALVAPGCIYGYDVMVYAGESIFRHCHNAEQTASELKDRNVPISASKVRDLAARFVVSLGIAHTEAAPRLRYHLRSAGGYVLHIDSTCKNDSAHLLTGIDETSGFVLLNAKVLSESSSHVSDFLRDMLARFGPPQAVSCDMSAGILSAVSSELPDVPVCICHFHFLRDIGNDLLAEQYAIIRSCLRRHGLKAELKRMQRELQQHVQHNSEVIEELLNHVRSTSNTIDNASVNALPCRALVGALVTSILDAERDGDGCGFPFDRPQLLFLRQTQAVFRAVTALRDSHFVQSSDRKLCSRLTEALRPVCSDQRLIDAADTLTARAEIFDRLRTAMRIAQPETRKGLNDNGEPMPITTIRHNVNSFCDELQHDDTLISRPEYRKMLAQIDRYRDKLFADPIHVDTPDGKRIIQPQRTNNILERFFRGISSQGCKRTGRRPGAGFIDTMLADTPLVANLDNPDYLNILLDGYKNLAQRLADVDQKLLNETMTELGKSRSGLKPRQRATLRRPQAVLRIALLMLKNAA